MASVVLMINSKVHGMYGMTLNGVDGSNKSEISRNAIVIASKMAQVPARSIRVRKVI